MFVDFVLGWGANFVGIVKRGRVSKSLRTSGLEFFSGKCFLTFVGLTVYFSIAVLTWFSATFTFKR